MDAKFSKLSMSRILRYIVKMKPNLEFLNPFRTDSKESHNSGTVQLFHRLVIIFLARDSRLEVFCMESHHAT